ncbi:hypothetical protein KAR02_04690, partial [Candidatus Bipolaricaulota bacterium]|nr:hypothetical protein [Candidatus Bipolaricaulota bacterium]
AKSDPGLLEMAHGVSARHPNFGVREISMKGAYTEGAIGAKHGLRILTFESHRADGTLSDWHRPTDKVENVSAKCMQATESLLHEFLRELDANAVSA